VGLAPDATSDVYWLVASESGAFSFAGGALHGSMSAVRLNRPAIGTVA